MKNFKKTLRWFIIISLIILAVGIGILGAASVVENRKRELENDAKVEQVDQTGTSAEKE